MQTIRRFYLYAIAFISLEFLLWGSVSLARSLVDFAEVSSERTSLASALSLILVGLPVFLLHWWLVQRSALGDLEERSARLRAIFLYGVLLATLAPAVENILALINRLLLEAHGFDPSLALIGRSQSLGDNLIVIALNALVAAFIYWVLRSDWSEPLLGETFPETRRLYRYLWLVCGLVLGVIGFQQFLLFVFEVMFSSGAELHPRLANSLALLIVAIPLWIYFVIRTQRSLTQVTERTSVIRLVVLYAFVFLSAGGLVFSIALILEAVFKVLLGELAGLASFVEAIKQPISVAIPLVGVWAYYGPGLSKEISALPESPRRNSLRRIYYYMLALLGLGVTFAGLQVSLSVLLNVLIGKTFIGNELLRTRLSSGLANFIVGLPLWISTWGPMATEAAQQGESGAYARRSLLRKTYLYLIIFAGVIGVMVTGGNLFFQLVSDGLGAPPQNIRLEILQLLDPLALFSILLAYHWQVLRSDDHIAADELEKRHSQFAVLVLVPEEGEFATSMVQALERQVTGLPIAIHPIPQGTPDETLSAAKAVILPAELLAKPSEALRLWLQGFQGTRLVVPTPAENWHWVFGSGRSLASVAQETAEIVHRLAEKEEMPLTGHSAPWMTAVYIMAGLFAFELVLALGWLLIRITSR